MDSIPSSEIIITFEENTITEPAAASAAPIAPGIIHPLHANGKIKKKIVYQCDLCEKIFPTPSKVTVHRRTHTGEKPFQCTECSDSFRTKRALHDHTLIHTNEKPFSCDVCGAQFRQSGGLSAHRKNTNCGNVTTTFKKCAKCDQTFADRASLLEHKKTHAKDKMFVCDTCGQRFTRLHQAKVHQRIHTGERPHACEFCDKRFYRNNDLRVHLRTHTGHKPYKCHNCSLTFTHRVQLVQHMCPFAANDGDTAGRLVEPEPCRLCDYIPSDVKDMQLHRQRHDEGPSGSASQCPTCHRLFKTKHALSVHQRTHSDDRPFSCTTCHKAFRQLVHLQEHRKIHSFQAYTCERCGFHVGSMKAERRHQCGKDDVRSTSTTEQLFYKCATCYSSFDTLDEAVNHQCPGDVPADTTVAAEPTKQPETTSPGPSSTDTVAADSQNETLTLEQLVADHPEWFDVNTEVQIIENGDSSEGITFEVGDVADTIPGPVIDVSANGSALDVASVVEDCEMSADDEDTIAEEANTAESEFAIENFVEDESPSTMNDGTAKVVVIPTSDVLGEPQPIEPCYIEDGGEMDSNSESTEYEAENDTESVETAPLDAVIVVANNDDIETRAKTPSCKKCGEQFTDYEALNEHRKLAHSAEYSCGYCGKNFSHKNRLNWHVKNVHINPKPFKCSKCGRTFSRRVDCQAHVNSHNGVKEFVCQDCGRSFNYKRSLQVHSKMVHEASPFVCDGCGQRFLYRNQLTKHELSHHGNPDKKLFSCEECGASYTRVAYLTRHMKRHAEQQPWQCQFCNVNCTSQETYDRHMKSHLRERPFKCSLCERSFAKKSTLKQHFDSHTGKRPYACKYCDKRFRQRGHRMEHERTHLGDTPFRCGLCPFKSAYRACYQYHIKHKHPEGVVLDAVDVSLPVLDSDQIAQVVVNPPPSTGTSDVQDGVIYVCSDDSGQVLVQELNGEDLVKIKLALDNSETQKLDDGLPLQIQDL